ncbi:MAG: hypothetical protein WAP74_03370 [Patescibacteria group bacterium]
MKQHFNHYQEFEDKLTKPRKRRPRVKVSGRSVLKLREIITRKARAIKK